MTAQGTAWGRWILRVLSLVLPVGVAVASNQILTEGVWSWWWTGIAVALTAGSTLVTYRLTRPPANDPASTQVTTPGLRGQVVEDSTAGGSIDQLRGVTGSVRLLDTAAPLPPPAMPAGPGEAAQAAESAEAGTAAGDREPPPVDGGQRVSRSRAGGSITQIDGVGGDVTIERS